MAWYATKKAAKLLEMDKSRILIFDTETTGLDSQIDEILQISILDGYGSTLFSSYIKPKHHKIWTLAEKVNHISRAMVKDAPYFSDVREKIQEIFSNALLVVGYNVGFDIRFIQEAGIIVSGQTFDVMTAFSSYYADISGTHYSVRRKLADVADYFGISYSPHKATEDAYVTYLCFNKLLDDKRFTPFKKREKKEIKKEIKEYPETNHNMDKVSTKVKGFFGTIHIPSIVLNLLMMTVGILILYNDRRICITDLPELIINLKKEIVNFSIDKQSLLPYILILIGAIRTAIYIIKRVIRIPIIIMKKVDHLFRRFR